jgi:hypothetical protein
MTSEKTDCKIHLFPKLPGLKRLRALALFGTATILIPAAQAQVFQENDDLQDNLPSGNATRPIGSSRELPPSRFQRLPSLTATRESFAIYSSEGFTKFSPLPSLDDLPQAPEGLVELAESLAIEPSLNESSSQEEKKAGSDFNAKSVKTEGITALQKPLAPLDILKKTDAISSTPEGRPRIESFSPKSMQLKGLPNTPDPRYLRHWPANQASWASPAFCYKPLYFEQINLERYGIGYSCPTNALVSGGKFFADATLLPVKIFKTHPHSCECTLGHRRPGDCTPVQKPVR